MAKRYDNHHYGVDACGLDFWHLVGSFRNITTFITYILYSVPVEPKLLLRLNTQTQNWENIATTVSLANIWWHITNTFIITSFITIKNIEKHSYYWARNINKGIFFCLQLLKGNRNSRSLKKNVFKPPIRTRSIRIYPKDPFRFLMVPVVPCLRLELYGCSAPGR